MGGSRHKAHKVLLPSNRALSALRSRINASEFPLLWSRLQQRVEQTQLPAGPFGRVRRWWAVCKETSARLGPERFVDVRELIAASPSEEHVARADAYFSGVGWHTMHARKPFAEPLEAEHLSRTLFALLPHLELYRGARLLDFGAGTCWSSLIWAYLGCTVIATDVSANALRFGEQRVRADPIGKDLPVSFLRFDGQRFELPDACVDRVVGIETLHHVCDIPATLAELARVLAPGGIAAFSEPGPFHSVGPQAQHEMATTGVIENDIRVAEIRTAALAAGFEDMRVAWFAAHAQLLDVDEFDRLAAGRVRGSEAQRIVREIGMGLANIRIFFLYARGSRPLANQAQSGLAARLDGDVRFDGARLHGRLVVTNVGRATWPPSGEDRGAVNIGVRSRERDGRQPEVARIALSADFVAPGQSRTVSIDLPLVSADSVVLDLVAESVMWFSSAGNAGLVVARKTPVHS